jgi:hypothetical protein
MFVLEQLVYCTYSDRKSSPKSAYFSKIYKLVYFIQYFYMLYTHIYINAATLLLSGIKTY